MSDRAHQKQGLGGDGENRAICPEESPGIGAPADVKRNAAPVGLPPGIRPQRSAPVRRQHVPPPPFTIVPRDALDAAILENGASYKARAEIAERMGVALGVVEARWQLLRGQRGSGQ